MSPAGKILSCLSEYDTHKKQICYQFGGSFSSPGGSSADTCEFYYTWENSNFEKVKLPNALTNVLNSINNEVNSKSYISTNAQHLIDGYNYLLPKMQDL